MSKFCQVTQASAYDLLENQTDLNLNVRAINITNTGTTKTIIDLHVQPNSGGASHSIVNTTVPGKATLIYDTAFSFPPDHTLKITPDNTNALHIIIN